MNKIILLLCSITMFKTAAAQLPQVPNDVDFYPIEKEVNYQNIPHVWKEFEGAKDKQQRALTQKECQEWVIDQMNKEPAPYFKVWCSYETDVVLREYVITGHLLIKNWK